MIMPIVAYGDPVLNTKCKPITPDYPGLKELIAHMYDTMYNANGVGLAAPQIGQSIRLFVVDAEQYDEVKYAGTKKIFINAEILERSGEPWAFNEGCLSIPEVRGDVMRPAKITIRYQDENFKEHIEEFDDIPSRVIQHEYDHIEGVLFTELLSPLKRRMVLKKLELIKRGIVNADYRMKFAKVFQRRR